MGVKPKYRKLQNYLDSLQAIDKEQEIKVEGEKGLVLRVFKSGRKIFYYYYRDADNIRRKHKIGLFDPTGVDGYWLERAIDEADKIRGTDPRKARIKERKQGALVLREFLDQEYYPYIEVEHKAYKRTKQIMEWNFKCFMKKRIDKISQKDMDTWQRKKKAGKLRHGKREQYRDGQPSAPATINRAVGVLTAAISKAVEWKLIDVNQIRGRKKLPTPRTAGKFMSEEEIAKLYIVLDNRKDYLPVLVKLLLNTGLRPKEAFTQTWDTADLVSRVITVKSENAKNGTERKIPMNNTVHALLTEWKAKQVHDLYVFPNPSKNAPMTRAQKAWRKLIKDAEIPHYRLYDCRHSFASKLANTGGIPLKVVADLLGHKSISMTEIYSHKSESKMADAIYTLD